jgi:hypothetical protein
MNQTDESALGFIEILALQRPQEIKGIFRILRL